MTKIDPGNKDLVEIYEIEIGAPHSGPSWANGNGMKDARVKDSA